MRVFARLALAGSLFNDAGGEQVNVFGLALLA